MPPVCTKLSRPGANTGVDFAFSRKTSIDSLVTRAMEGRSITAGSASGSANSVRVASAVAMKAPAALWPYSKPTVACPFASAYIRHLARCARNSLSPSNSSRLLMRWLSLSTKTRIGSSLPLARVSSTLRDNQAASSTPTGKRPSTPMTTIMRPVGRVPCPHSNPWLSTTSWPLGNNESRISASIMVRFLQAIGEHDEIAVRHGRYRASVGSTQGNPNIPRVLASAKAFETLFEARLLCLEGHGIQGRCALDEVCRRLAKAGHRVVHKDLCPANQTTMFAAHGAPDQCSILAVEFLDAPVRLDDLRSRHTDASLLGHRESRAASGDQSAAAVTAGAAADQTHH